MKISIITSVYNNKETIAEAIESVLSQAYDNIEYIIIDGASKDGTVDIIRSYGDQISTFVSEPDRGIYDGLNKGVARATGDVIAFLHSDDLYADPEVITRVAQAFSATGADAVYGDLVYTPKSDTSKVLRYWKSRDFKPELLKQGWMPAHPTFFVRRELYEKYGTFDTSFRIAADYDFMLRVLSKGIQTHYLPNVLYKMRVGGESNKSIKNIIKKMREDYRALSNNNIGGISTLMIKNLSKIPQFLKK
jgi:glycosyltransferase